MQHNSARLSVASISAIKKTCVVIIPENSVHGDICLGFVVTKGQLEIDVICARELSLNAANQPPGTFSFSSSFLANSVSN